MVSETSNDNSGAAARSGGPDPHGQAAMLLVESLLHGLIARKVITVGDAVEIVDIAAEAKAEIDADRGDSPAETRRSIAILGSVSASLKHDLPND